MRPFFNNLPDGFGQIQYRFLRQEAECNSLLCRYFPEKILILACYDPEQRAFSGAVQTQNADFCPIEKGEVNIFEYLAVRLNNFSDSDHGKYNFIIGHILGFFLWPVQNFYNRTSNIVEILITIYEITEGYESEAPYPHIHRIFFHLPLPGNHRIICARSRSEQVSRL